MVFDIVNGMTKLRIKFADCYSQKEESWNPSLPFSGEIMNRMVIAGALLLATSACKNRDFNHHDDSETMAVVGTPDGRQIPGRLLRDVELKASEADSSATLCRLNAEDIDIAKFSKGKYRVYRKGRTPCNSGNPDSFRGWVPADAVDFEESAYFGKLVEVKANSAIAVKMNYAGNKIFCTNGNCKIKEPLYGKNRCYAHSKVNAYLQDAAIALKREKGEGYKLQLLDCYRPVYVQIRMAELVSDPQWVAQPSGNRYGGHNGGIAIDLTIEKDGVALEMGSGFDEFSSRSVYDAAGISSEARSNRALLKKVMTSAGFKDYSGEWWHFSMPIDVTPLDLAL